MGRERDATMTLGFTRLPNLLERRGDSRSNTYRDVEAGLWTPPIKLGPRYSAWPTHEVDQLIAARIAGASHDEIRALVRSLMIQRRQLMPRFDAPTEPCAAPPQAA
jgi:prophage regulatory protein